MSADTNKSAMGGRYDVAVCFRIYPRVSGKPIFDFKEKYPLVKLNLESFKESIGDLKVKMWVLLDNCPAEYGKLVWEIFPDAEIFVLDGVGNQGTFGKQIGILSKQTESDLVYFAEDDYLYLPRGLEKAVKFMRENPDADFATLYEHSDYSRMYVHRVRSETRKDGDTEWRTVTSTCVTFMTRKQVLVETEEVFRSYQRMNSDLGFWLALTKNHVFNPLSLVLGLKDGKFIPASIVMAWWHSAGYILGGKRRTLWYPHTGFATHMEKAGLAPGVDWEGVFGTRARKLISESVQK